MCFRLSTALGLGQGVEVWGRGATESSLRGRKEEELLNELSSHPEVGDMAGLSPTVRVTIFPEYNQGTWLLLDVKSIWQREIGSRPIRIFHDIYADCIRGQKRRI